MILRPSWLLPCAYQTAAQSSSRLRQLSAARCASIALLKTTLISTAPLSWVVSTTHPSPHRKIRNVAIMPSLSRKSNFAIMI